MFNTIINMTLIAFLLALTLFIYSNGKTAAAAPAQDAVSVSQRMGSAFQTTDGSVSLP